MTGVIEWSKRTSLVSRTTFVVTQIPKKAMVFVKHPLKRKNDWLSNDVVRGLVGFILVKIFRNK